MPRVLRIINRLNLGGPTYNATYLTKYLEPEFETLLVAGMKDETEASSEFIPKELGIEPVYIPDMYRSINPLKDAKAYRRIRAIINEFQPDIVHTHAAKAGAVGRLAAYNANVPIILHTFHGHVFHSYFHPLKTSLFLEIERYLAEKSSRLIAISDLQMEELTSDFKIAPQEKFSVVPLGFDLNRFKNNQQKKRQEFRERHNIEDDEIAIGIIGRLVPIKNHTLFLDALSKVSSQSTKKIRVFIIGDGEEKENIYAKVNQLGFSYSMPHQNGTSSSFVTFTSWYKDIDEVNAGLDIVALTSNNEGTPVSLIEAQAANKPIVSTNVGGVSDIVQHGETALLSPPFDTQQFAHNLLKMIDDDDFRIELGQKGAVYVQEKYHYTNLINNMTQLYRQLLNEA